MKTFFGCRLTALLGVALAAVAPLRAGENVWTPGGPPGRVVSLASDAFPSWVLLPDRTAFAFYALTDSGVWRSDDGESWTLVSSGMRAPQIQAIAADPSTRGRVVAAGCGAFESDDFGVNWTPIGRGLPPGCSLTTIAVNPVFSGDLYASGPSGLYHTVVDSLGVLWEPSGQGLFTGPVLMAFAVPGSAFFAYAAPEQSGLFATSYGAASWTAVEAPPGASVRTLYANSTAILAGTDQGLFQSAAGGSGWSEADPFFSGLPVEWYLHTFYADYAATAEGIARRANYGGTWENFDFQIPVVGAARVFNDPTGRVLVALPRSGEGLLTYRYGLPTLRFANDHITTLAERRASLALIVDPPQPALVFVSAVSSDSKVLMAYDSQIYPFQSTAQVNLFANHASTEPAQVSVEVPGNPLAVPIAAFVTVINPHPDLAYTDPSTLPAGSPATSIYLFDSDFGRSFVADSVAYWNGSPRPTRHPVLSICPGICLDYLIVDLTREDLARPGTARVTVVNPSPGGGESNPLAVPIDSLIARPPINRATAERPFPRVKTPNAR